MEASSAGPWIPPWKKVPVTSGVLLHTWLWHKWKVNFSWNRDWDLNFSLLHKLVWWWFSCYVIYDSCNPMDCSMPGLPVHHQPAEFTQTHVHRVSDCHPTISSSVIPFSSCPQSFSASWCFQMSQLITWGGQSIGVSASTSVLPMNTQDWSLGWTGWISLQSKGLSRVFSNTTVQKHQLCSSQLFLQSNSHIHTWLLEKP